MNPPDTKAVQQRAVDSIQQTLTGYATHFRFENLPADTVHAAKVRVIDTLGALMGGFAAEPCRIARNVAALMPNADGATVIGTRLKTTPEMAAAISGVVFRRVPMTVAPSAFGINAATFRAMRQGSAAKPPIKAPSVSITRTFAACTVSAGRFSKRKCVA